MKKSLVLRTIVPALSESQPLQYLYGIRNSQPNLILFHHDLSEQWIGKGGDAHGIRELG